MGVQTWSAWLAEGVDIAIIGGSTIVVLFERGAVEWDEDLVVNGRAALETLVRVGMGIGRRRRVAGMTTNGAQIHKP